MVKNLPAMKEGIGYPLQYSCLENSMDKGAWKSTVHGVPKSQIQLSDFTFTFILSGMIERDKVVLTSVLSK